jgi:hypothetical protein
MVASQFQNIIFQHVKSWLRIGFETLLPIDEDFVGHQLYLARHNKRIGRSADIYQYFNGLRKGFPERVTLDWFGVGRGGRRFGSAVPIQYSILNEAVSFFYRPAESLTIFSSTISTLTAKTSFRFNWHTICSCGVG